MSKYLGWQLSLLIPNRQHSFHLPHGYLWVLYTHCIFCGGLLWTSHIWQHSKESYRVSRLLYSRQCELWQLLGWILQDVACPHSTSYRCFPTIPCVKDLIYLLQPGQRGRALEVISSSSGADIPRFPLNLLQNSMKVLWAAFILAAVLFIPIRILSLAKVCFWAIINTKIISKGTATEIS